jgi:N-acetylglutamate synthase/N-acetylornithine aminotransferase
MSAVVVNSGNANCCSGQVGIKNAIKMCSLTASLVGLRLSSAECPYRLAICHLQFGVLLS